MIIIRRADMSSEEIKHFWENVDKTSNCWIWKAGTSKGCSGRYGELRYKGVHIKAHRFAYAIVHGECPTNLVIDHMCHNTLCVNPEHLQAVTAHQNCENRVPNKNSKTKIRGVCWHKRANKWRVKVTVNRVDYHGGYFDDIHDAEKAAITLRDKLMDNNLQDKPIKREDTHHA